MEWKAGVRFRSLLRDAIDRAHMAAFILLLRIPCGKELNNLRESSWFVSSGLSLGLGFGGRGALECVDSGTRGTLSSKPATLPQGAHG